MALDLDNNWEQRYQSGQTGWDRGETSANLLHWIALGLLKPCRILIPACGNGHEVLTLATLGFDVVAVDIAPTPLAHLATQLKQYDLHAELIQADFFHWQPTQTFDAIYEQTSLCALPPEQWHDYEACLFKWLKPNGKLFAQFMQTEQKPGPPFHCSITDMLALFSAEQWLWSEQYETQVIHSSGKYENLFMLAKTS